MVSSPNVRNTTDKIGGTATVVYGVNCYKRLLLLNMIAKMLLCCYCD